MGNALTVGQNNYTLNDYDYNSSTGTLLAIELIVNGQNTWLFYHPGGSTNLKVIVEAAHLIHGVWDVWKKKTGRGRIFWGVMTAIGAEDFIHSYKTMGGEEGYYADLTGATSPMITGRLTINSVT